MMLNLKVEYTQNLSKQKINTHYIPVDQQPDEEPELEHIEINYRDTEKWGRFITFRRFLRQIANAKTYQELMVSKDPTERAKAPTAKQLYKEYMDNLNAIKAQQQQIEQPNDNRKRGLARIFGRKH